MSRVAERGGKWETWIQVQLYFLTGTPRAVLLTFKKQISTLFLFNSFFLVLYPLFSLQNNLSTFKTQSQLSNQTSNDLFEILVSFSLALLPSPFSFFHHSPFAAFHTYTHRRAPLSIHNPTTVRLSIVLKQITAARTIDAIVHVGRIQRRVLVAQYFHRLLPSNAPEEKTKRHQRLSAQ